MNKSAESNTSQITLPEALLCYRNKLYLACVGTTTAAIFLFLLTQKPASFVILFLATYFFIQGVRIAPSYSKGSLIEQPCVCESIRLSPVQDRFSVTFSVQNEENKDPVYRTYWIYGKKKIEDFSVNGAYLIYFYCSSDKVITAYQIL